MSRTRPRLALAVFCVCLLANLAWAQHHGSGSFGGGGFGSHGGGGFGSHAGGGFGSHASGPGFGSRPVFGPGPSSAPRPFYGAPSPYRRPIGPSSFTGPSHFAPPRAGFQHFRGSPSSGGRPPARQGLVPRSAYLGARNPHYASPMKSHGPSATPWRSFSGARGSHPTAGSHGPMNSFHGDHHHPGHPHNPFFTIFFNPYPFFYWPFFYPTYSWWSYPPFGFSDFGCPYDDYYRQQQPYYYEPEQGANEQPSTGEAQEPSEGAEQAPAPPPEEPQEQAAPFVYEKPLPDVIEWGKASEAEREKRPALSSRGPLVVNFPHHALTILLDQPNSPASLTPQSEIPH